jgi:signal transduction histidine kinase
VPAIFVANPEAAAEAQIRPGVTGLVRRQPLRNSVNAVRALVPSVRRIALVGDVPRREYQRARFKEEIPSLAAGVEIIDLTGLRMVELRGRVAALPADTVIYFTTLTFDGDQPAFISRDALAAVSEVANSPIIVDLETHVGYGSVGGLVADPSAIGRALARLALRIIGGESASNIPVVTGDFVRPIFDWRQLQRWGISERRLPPGSEIRFRQPTAWEQYQWQIMLIAVALLSQTGLIIGLFQEHRRRRMAEVEARHRMAELAHMNRAATAGELSASIAHELNQPLTAITANSSAALRWLASATPDLNEARAALKSVVDEGHRASRLIGDIRAMYRKDDQRTTPLDVNELIRDVVALLQDELKSREVEIQTELSPAIPQVTGSRVQLQQVILNLIMNAAEAMDAVTDRPRTLRIKTEREKDNGVLITLQDSGPGIDPESTDRIFNAFFTTKPHGMGMGLSICRSIVEAHGGRLWTSAGMDQGAVFHIALPPHHSQ